MCLEINVGDDTFEEFVGHYITQESGRAIVAIPTSFALCDEQYDVQLVGDQWTHAEFVSVPPETLLDGLTATSSATRCSSIACGHGARRRRKACAWGHAGRRRAGRGTRRQ